MSVTASTSTDLSLPSPGNAVALQNAVTDREAVLMPVLGLGTGGYLSTNCSQRGGTPVHPNSTTTGVECWDDDAAERYASLWFAAGGRAIDAALEYKDQRGIGRAIQKSGLSRSDIWVTSKVNNPKTFVLANGTDNVYQGTLQAFENITRELQLQYVDLLLTHWPNAGSVNTTAKQYRQENWKALVHILKTGGARAIGVSNYEIQHLEDIEEVLFDGKPILPAVNQMEFHPYYHQDALLAYCRSKNITFDAYSPLGVIDVISTGDKWAPVSVNHSAIRKIAAQHPGYSPAQVVLACETQSCR